jgi:hypothetical protein
MLSYIADPITRILSFIALLVFLPLILFMLGLIWIILAPAEE